ncbi:MAG TPA: caspase family protein [Hyphomicrobiaceae bacterium]|nr:caspase family protein [Hyphomicrobiaceae bacterium]
MAAYRMIALLIVGLLHGAVQGLVSEARAQDRRVALVIGNASYKHAPTLATPLRDVADLAKALENIGFRVIAGRNLTKVEMERTVRSFADALAGAEIGLFFYAGHGLQVAGQNYLVPIDARLSTLTAIDFEMVRLDLIQRAMEHQARTNVLFIDACRDNPLARDLSRAMGTRSGDVGRGLVAAEAGHGTLISFSTQPGNVALDGTGRNSPFAEALVKRIAAPGEDLSTLLIGVRNDVMRATERRQVPWEHSALTERICLSGPCGAAGDAGTARASEIAFWNSVKDSADAAILKTYLDRYPNGDFASLARALIEKANRTRPDPLPASPAPSMASLLAPQPAAIATSAIPIVAAEAKRGLDITRRGILIDVAGDQVVAQTAVDADGAVGRVTVTALSRGFKSTWFIFALVNSSSEDQTFEISADKVRAATGAPLEAIAAVFASVGFQPKRKADREKDVFSAQLLPGMTVTYVLEILTGHAPRIHVARMP